MGTITYQIPQAGGQNATEDPKIPTALTTLLNVINGNLDTNNLSGTAGITFAQMAAGSARLTLRAVSTSATAADGQLVNVAGGTPCTITLPAPSVDATVGVFVSYASVSGASPVTVHTAGADRIFTLGVTSAASILLGAQGAFVVLQSDGANWVTIAGQQDSGWVAITLGAGVTSTGGYTPAARLRGDTVNLCGNLSHTSTAAWGTVPAGLRPAGTVLFGVPSAAPSFINAAGALQTGSPTVTVPLDGLNYRIS